MDEIDVNASIIDTVSLLYPKFLIKTSSNQVQQLLEMMILPVSLTTLL